MCLSKCLPVNRQLGIPVSGSREWLEHCVGQYGHHCRPGQGQFLCGDRCRDRMKRLEKTMGCEDTFSIEYRQIFTVERNRASSGIGCTLEEG